MPKARPDTIKPEVESKILELEYHYIQSSIEETNSDRLKLGNFYVTIAGAAGTAMLGLVSLGKTELVPLIAVLSVGVWFVGVIFILMLIRLRQAWYENMQALNQIKHYYIDISEEALKLRSAFKWTKATIPAKQRLWNIHFYTVILVSAISSLFLAFGIALAWKSLAISFLFGVANLLGEALFYRVSLSKNL